MFAEPAAQGRRPTAVGRIAPHPAASST